MSKIFSALMVLLCLSSCYYHNVEELFPEIPECDTLNVTYSGTIQPILQTSCYACHSNSNAAFSGGGLKMEDYEDVLLLAEDGSLFGTISHAAGYPPMPRGGAKLSDCKLDQVRIWIENGSPNN